MRSRKRTRRRRGGNAEAVFVGNDGDMTDVLGRLAEYVDVNPQDARVKSFYKTMSHRMLLLFTNEVRTNLKRRIAVTMTLECTRLELDVLDHLKDHEITPEVVELIHTIQH